MLNGRLETNEQIGTWYKKEAEAIYCWALGHGKEYGSYTKYNWKVLSKKKKKRHNLICGLKSHLSSHGMMNGW